MSTPTWPGLEWAQTEIDARAAARNWRIKGYNVRDGNNYAEVTRLGERWYATTIVHHHAHTLPTPFSSAAAAMAAADQVLNELADET